MRCERAKMAIFLWLAPRPALAGSYLSWGRRAEKSAILNAPKFVFCPGVLGFATPIGSTSAGRAARHRGSERVPRLEHTRSPSDCCVVRCAWSDGPVSRSSGRRAAKLRCRRSDGSREWPVGRVPVRRRGRGCGAVAARPTAAQRHVGRRRPLGGCCPGAATAPFWPPYSVTLECPGGRWRTGR